MLTEIDRRVFDALNFHWEPGVDVRERLQTFGLTVSGPVFSTKMDGLTEEGIADRKMVSPEGSDSVLYVKRCIDGSPPPE
ncbi:hypothetical protein CMO91_03340 [Candidatus Woesearchaeota archaeon]|jgi:hypothetical protein|nr:hypothetical protein [Candidatus Woesearchaeota archaeon]|tara:strand:- start:867 stop:1106 length:240 start_codon:yes stop_codon:yes gene_type:complete